MIGHGRDGQGHEETEDGAEGRDIERDGTRLQVMTKDWGDTIVMRDRGVTGDRDVRSLEPSLGRHVLDQQWDHQ